jgi:hypothetical protein
VRVAATGSLYSNQITDADIHIPDIFAVIRLDFPVFATPGAARRAGIFSWCSMLNTFDNWVNWETGCNEFFGSHGSGSAFNSSHLTNRDKHTNQ